MERFNARMSLKEIKDLNKEDQKKVQDKLNDLPEGDFFYLQGEYEGDTLLGVSQLCTMTQEEYYNYLSSGGVWTYTQKLTSDMEKASKGFIHLTQCHLENLQDGFWEKDSIPNEVQMKIAREVLAYVKGEGYEPSLDGIAEGTVSNWFIKTALMFTGKINPCFNQCMVCDENKTADKSPLCEDCL